MILGEFRDGMPRVTLSAGLELNTSGLIPSSGYSAELVFKFTRSESSNGWFRIVDPNSRLNLFTGGSNPLPSMFDLNTYYHLVVTDSVNNSVSVYLNGTLEGVITGTDAMNISSANRLRLFADDNGREFADGKIALFRVYNNVLSASEVATLAVNPFGVAAAPEPSALALLMGGVGAMAGVAWRRRSVRK